MRLPLTGCTADPGGRPGWVAASSAGLTWGTHTPASADRLHNQSLVSGCEVWQALPPRPEMMWALYLRAWGQGPGSINTCGGRASINQFCHAQGWNVPRGIRDDVPGGIAWCIWRENGGKRGCNRSSASGHGGGGFENSAEVTHFLVGSLMTFTSKNLLVSNKVSLWWL